jgi:preprotein translocase subunit SecD
MNLKGSRLWCSPILAIVAALGCGERAAPVRFELFEAQSAPAAGLASISDPATGKTFYLPAVPIISNSDVRRADTGLDQFGNPAVELYLTAKGAQAMTTATRPYEERPIVLVVLVDSKFQVSYDVKTTTYDGVIITGKFPNAEAKAVAEGIMSWNTSP